MLSADRLERYKDFTDPGHTGQIYDPRRGIERLLTVLTPDTKGIVLAAMGDEIHFGGSSLHASSLRWVEKNGLARQFPISIQAVWNYCQLPTPQGLVDGSLVEIGAVVKQTDLPTATGYKTGYSRSEAGAELALPLVQQAMDFVSEAKRSGIAHKFDSMVRILGGVASTADTRRQLVLYDVIQFLIENAKGQRLTDIVEQTNLSRHSVFKVLDNLGKAGVVDYVSPSNEKNGKRRDKWVVCEVGDKGLLEDCDPSQIYKEIKKARPKFGNPGAIEKVVEYLKTNQEGSFEASDLAVKLDLNKQRTSVILKSLVELGLLKRPDSNLYNDKRTSASANELTLLLNELVLQPTRFVAETLQPLPLRRWDREKIRLYLENYNEERTRLGQQGGEEVRGRIMLILQAAGEPLKLSDIKQQYNEQSERTLDTGISKQVIELVRLGLIEKEKPGFYRIVSS